MCMSRGNLCHGRLVACEVPEGECSGGMGMPARNSCSGEERIPEEEGVRKVWNTALIVWYSVKDMPGKAVGRRAGGVGSEKR